MARDTRLNLDTHTIYKLLYMYGSDVVPEIYYKYVEF